MVSHREQTLVLVVEDDAAIRRLLQDILQDEGYQVVTASDGESAVELLETSKPDLILLDVRLPGIDGHGVAAAYREMQLRERAPILFVSASTPGPELPEGVIGFVRKPFDLDELVARIGEAVSGLRPDIDAPSDSSS